MPPHHQPANDPSHLVHPHPEQQVKLIDSLKQSLKSDTVRQQHNHWLVDFIVCIFMFNMKKLSRWVV